MGWDGGHFVQFTYSKITIIVAKTIWKSIKLNIYLFVSISSVFLDQWRLFEAVSRAWLAWLGLALVRISLPEKMFEMSLYQNWLC